MLDLPAVNGCKYSDVKIKFYLLFYQTAWNLSKGGIFVSSKALFTLPVIEVGYQM
jgi:hypothetical protein